ncbi:MAG: NAD(P)/FAD-dependent oxidoreductase [Gammaproteobacteria bacterium]|nr:NAD(P)/FAD-dependent oxidoreductase [Gammaproteobacteria bacterium]
MREYDADAIIIGAGAVGLASGYALAQRSLSVIVLEAGPRIGEGVSSRNSEVIHAGFYYAPGSLKTRVCVEGRRRLYEFLESHGVPYWRCGKLVVATEDAEIPAIEKMYQQGLANDVEHLQILTADEARALEPELHCVAAMLSPESGVFDSHGYMLALRGEIESRSGFVVCEAPFIGASADPADGWQVRTGGDAPATLNCRALVTAPGLEAQEVAAMIEGFPTSKIPHRHLAKGVYFKVSGKAPFNRLVYPPPIPGALGTHYRKNLGGQAILGPDLAYVDAIDYSVDPTREQSFYENVRRYWPTLATGTLVPDYAGIRPKIHGPGEKQPDFRIDGPELHGLPNLVTLFGTESPGLTSSLAIGEEVAARLLSSQNNYSP